MIDRKPKYPGRVKLTPVAEKTDTYDLTWADEPVQEGTSLNKANLLSAITSKSIFEDDADHTVNEALHHLSLRGAKTLCECSLSDLTSDTAYEFEMLEDLRNYEIVIIQFYDMLFNVSSRDTLVGMYVLSASGDFTSFAYPNVSNSDNKTAVSMVLFPTVLNSDVSPGFVIYSYSQAYSFPIGNIVLPSDLKTITLKFSYSAKAFKMKVVGIR